MPCAVAALVVASTTRQRTGTMHRAPVSCSDKILKVRGGRIALQGQATKIRLANFMPKLAPGDRLAKKASDNFFEAASSSGSAPSTLAEQPFGAPTRSTGSLSSRLKATK